MKRPSRILSWLTWGGVVVSLLMFIAVVRLWARSTNRCYFYSWGNSSREFSLDSGGGLVHLTYAADTSLNHLLRGWEVAHNDFPNALWTGVTPGPKRGGFAFYVSRTVGRPQGNWRLGGQRLFMMYFPHWSVALLSSLLPLWCGFRLSRKRLARHRRRKWGLCLICGYNLTGNVSGSCPECGEKI